MSKTPSLAMHLQMHCKSTKFLGAKQDFSNFIFDLFQMLKRKDFARSDTATQLHSVISKMQWWVKSYVIIIYYILYYNIIYNINIKPSP